MIAYPLHVIHGDSDDSLEYLKVQLYYTCLCIVGYVALLLVQGILLYYLVKT